MDIEILLNFNYEHLKNYLLNSSVDERKKVLYDDGVYNLNQLNLTFFNGASSQGEWGEMRSYHPDHALNYRNLAYVAGYIDLTTAAGVPQFNFEIAGKCIANGLDANPKDVMLDILTNSIYGAGFASQYIGFQSVNDFGNYCVAIDDSVCCFLKNQCKGKRKASCH